MKRTPLNPASVIDEAAKLADEGGFDAVTLSAVARRLAVQTPSLYAHVRDLAHLRDGVTVLALAELGDRVAGAIAGRSAGSALRGFADAHRGFADEHPGRWQSLQRRAGPMAVESDAARRFASLTDAVFRGYDLRPDDRVHATRLLASTINGFLTLESIGSFGHRTPAPDQSWDTALTAIDLILTAWHTGGDSTPTPKRTP